MSYLRGKVFHFRTDPDMFPFPIREFGYFIVESSWSSKFVISKPILSSAITHAKPITTTFTTPAKKRDNATYFTDQYSWDFTFFGGIMMESDFLSALVPRAGVGV